MARKKKAKVFGVAADIFRYVEIHVKNLQRKSASMLADLYF
jgi:hypothetical protein